MTATLVAKQLAAGHGDRVLFSGLDVTVAPADVVGLVGVNGAGKSTLLRLLAGIDTPEQGSVRISPVNANIGYLPQELERRPGETVGAFLSRRTGVAAAQRALDEAASALAEGRGDDDVYSEALDRWLALGGADLSERAEQVAAGVGLSVGQHQPMTTLSGGQAARVGLMSLLLSRYDVFLLDEPTNDLDLNGLEQLERFICGLRTGVVVVSHDREFLGRTVTRVVELDLAQQEVRAYDGGFDAYLEQREIDRRHARERYEEYADARAALEARARMFRTWMEAGVRNARRKSSDNDKFVRHSRLEGSEKQATKVRQTERLIERLEVAEEPRKEWDLRMEIALARRSGALVATLRNAVVRRGAFTLGPVSLQVGWAERIAVTGANGAGKTTLLDALLDRITLDEGSSNLGSGVVIGEIDQARKIFDGDGQLLECFVRLAELLPADARTVLAKFGLRAVHVMRPMTSLSPGERTRAALALLQAHGVNLLVLDEPTNHLDLPAIEQLEAALSEYTGTLLLVTHDRRLLRAVQTTRHLHVVDGQVREQ